MLIVHMESITVTDKGEISNLGYFRNKTFAILRMLKVIPCYLSRVGTQFLPSNSGHAFRHIVTQPVAPYWPNVNSRNIIGNPATITIIRYGNKNAPEDIT